MRSSMNLNKNLRTEQFDIDVCDDVAGFYASWFGALWDESGRSLDNRAIIRAVCDRWEKPGRAPENKPGRCSAGRVTLAGMAFSTEDPRGLI